MMSRKALAAAATLLALVVWTQAPAQQGDKKKAGADGLPAKEPVKKPATYKVEKKAFKIELSLKGVLQAEEVHEIAHRSTPTTGLPYHAGPLTVRSAVAHGTAVKKGDLLA